jgi:hypothetical protein
MNKILSKSEVMSYLKNFVYDIALDDERYYPKQKWLNYEKLFLVVIDHLETELFLYSELEQVIKETLKPTMTTKNKDGIFDVLCIRDTYLKHIKNSIETKNEIKEEKKNGIRII